MAAAYDSPVSLCLPLIVVCGLALQLISDAIAAAGYTGKIDIGMDVAASEFHK